MTVAPKASRAKDRAVVTYDLTEQERRASQEQASKGRHSLSRWVADAVRRALAESKRQS